MNQEAQLVSVVSEDQAVYAALLEQHLDLMKEKDRDFAKSLLQGNKKYGHFSDKQFYWVKTLVARAQGFAPVKAEAKTENIAGFQGVFDLFKSGLAALKKPKITLKIEGQKLQLSVAGPTAKCPGTINVTDGGGWGDNVWFGRVDANGTWTQSTKVTEEQLKPVRRFLQKLASSPAEIAAAYGKTSGACCFCNKELTDEQSKAAGFGEKCASNWGLLTEYKAAKGLTA